MALCTSAAASAISRFADAVCRPASRSPRRQRPARRRRCTRPMRASMHCALRVEPHRAGDADDGEVAAPARHFQKAGAGIGRRDRQFDFGQHLIRLERGGQRADKEIARLDPAFAAHRLRVQTAAEREHDRRHFGSRIGMREIAADGAAIADLRMRDDRQRFGDERQFDRASSDRARGCDSASARRCAGGRRRCGCRQARRAD